MKIKMNKELSRGLAIAAGIVLVFAAGLGILSRWEDHEEAIAETETCGPEAIRGAISAGGQWYVPKEGIETALLIGVDKFQQEVPEQESYINTQQSDFLLLAILNHKEETCDFLHINRDTMTEIPLIGVRGEDAGSRTEQLALAHTYGTGGKDSCRNTTKAVSNLLYGAKINHYLSMTMDAVEQLTDLVGGVEITFMDDFTMYDPAFTKGSTHRLNGQQALTYVRARGEMEDSSNLRRMERQRQFLTQMQATLEKRIAQDSSFVMKAMTALSEYILSDCTASQMNKLYDRIANYTLTDIQDIQGEAVLGEEFMEFYPDEQALQQQVLELFYTPYQEK